MRSEEILVPGNSPKHPNRGRPHFSDYLFMNDRSPFVCAFFSGRQIIGNQAGSPVAAHVVPTPLNQHEKFILELDQIAQMNEQPCEPSKEPRKAKAPHLRHGGPSADDRHGAVIVVAKRRDGLIF
jgi:hypothetical protein